MSIERNTQPPLCVGIGEVLWDVLPSGKALGGAPVNVTAHAVQLGMRGAAVSAVGNDSDGLEILRRLQTMGVDVSDVQVRHDLPTGMVDVALDMAGVPTFTIRAPAAWDAVEMNASLTMLADRADAVIYGSLAQRDPRSRKSIQAFLDATNVGCLKVFDVNLRHPFYDMEIIRDSLKQADVVKLNDTELQVLAGLLGLKGDEDALLYALLTGFDLDVLVYTRGAKGSRMLTADRVEEHPGCLTKVVDTVGAGDAFTATVTAGLLQGMDLSIIQDLANKVGAFVCSQAGAVPYLPEELTEVFLGVMQEHNTDMGVK